MGGWLAILKGKWCFKHKTAERGYLSVVGLGYPVEMCKACLNVIQRPRHDATDRLGELKALYERENPYTQVWIQTRDVGLMLGRIEQLEQEVECLKAT